MKKIITLCFALSVCLPPVKGFVTNLFGEDFHHDFFVLTPEEEREDTVLRLEDQASLAEYAKNDPERFVRRAALARLHAQPFLADVAENSVFFDMRRDAVEKIRDQNVLEKIIANDDNLEVRQAATRVLGNLTNLVDKAQNAESHAVEHGLHEPRNVINNERVDDKETTVKRNAEEGVSDSDTTCRGWLWLFMLPVAVGSWFLIRHRK